MKTNKKKNKVYWECKYDGCADGSITLTEFKKMADAEEIEDLLKGKGVEIESNVYWLAGMGRLKETHP